MATVKSVPPQPPYVFQPYPRWVDALDGARKMVHNATQETHETGILMNEDGTKAEAQGDGPKPPSIQEVMKAGYSEEKAREIVLCEQGMFARGEGPYAPMPADNPPATTPAAEQPKLTIVPPQTPPANSTEPVGTVNIPATPPAAAPAVQAGQTAEATPAKETVEEKHPEPAPVATAAG